MSLQFSFPFSSFNNLQYHGGNKKECNSDSGFLCHLSDLLFLTFHLIDAGGQAEVHFIFAFFEIFLKTHDFSADKN